MNVDMEKNERIEKFVLYGCKSKRNVKDHLFFRQLLGCFGAVICFALGLAAISGIANINIYHFFWSLLLIPIIPIFTIKVICKYMINKADLKEKRYHSVMTYAVPFVTIAFWSWVDQSLPQSTVSLINSVVALAGGLFCVHLVSYVSYKAYLIKKYAPYFKDERLRSPVQSEVEENEDA